MVYYVLFFPPKNVSFSDVVMNNNGSITSKWTGVGVFRLHHNPLVT